LRAAESGSSRPKRARGRRRRLSLSRPQGRRRQGRGLADEGPKEGVEEGTSLGPSPTRSAPDGVLGTPPPAPGGGGSAPGEAPEGAHGAAASAGGAGGATGRGQGLGRGGGGAEGASGSDLMRPLPSSASLTVIFGGQKCHGGKSPELLLISHSYGGAQALLVDNPKKKTGDPTMRHSRPCGTATMKLGGDC